MDSHDNPEELIFPHSAPAFFLSGREVKPLWRSLSCARRYIHSLRTRRGNDRDERRKRGGRLLPVGRFDDDIVADFSGSGWESDTLTFAPTLTPRDLDIDSSEPGIVLISGEGAETRSHSSAMPSSTPILASSSRSCRAEWPSRRVSMSGQADLATSCYRAQCSPYPIRSITRQPCHSNFK